MTGYEWQLLPTGGFVLMHADAPVCTIRPAHRGSRRRYACTYRGETHWRANWTDMQRHMETLIRRFAGMECESGTTYHSKPAQSSRSARWPTARKALP